jgi:predicted nucleotidyltransferase
MTEDRVCAAITGRAAEKQAWTTRRTASPDVGGGAVSDALTQISRKNLALDRPAARALSDFATAVRRHYGERLAALYLFGSRARGDHKSDSDVDVAVVLADGAFDFWREKMTLADLAFDPIAASEIHVQGWPVLSSAWDRPETHHNPALIRAMRRDGQVIGDVAA